MKKCFTIVSVILLASFISQAASRSIDTNQRVGATTLTLNLPDRYLDTGFIEYVAISLENVTFYGDYTSANNFSGLIKATFHSKYYMYGFNESDIEEDYDGSVVFEIDSASVGTIYFREDLLGRNKTSDLFAEYYWRYAKPVIFDAIRIVEVNDTQSNDTNQSVEPTNLALNLPDQRFVEGSVELIVQNATFYGNYTSSSNFSGLINATFYHSYHEYYIYEDNNGSVVFEVDSASVGTIYFREDLFERNETRDLFVYYYWRYAEPAIVEAIHKNTIAAKVNDVQGNDFLHILI